MSLYFFSSNTYYVEVECTKVNSGKSYKLYNSELVQIGSLIKVKSFKILKLIYPKIGIPYQLKITDLDENIISSIESDWAFKDAVIKVNDPKGNKLGSIEQKKTCDHSSFRVCNKTKQEIAIINKKMQIYDSSEKLMGSIINTEDISRENTSISKKLIKIKILPKSIHLAHKTIILSTAFAINRILALNK